MAKKKARTTGYDRPVTDCADGATWSVSTLEFLFVQGQAPVNLFVTIDGKRYGITYARDLKEAGFIAEGFTVGLEV